VFVPVTITPLLIQPKKKKKKIPAVDIWLFPQLPENNIIKTKLFYFFIFFPKQSIDLFFLFLPALHCCCCCPAKK
jgi:hypothetical protein